MGAGHDHQHHHAHHHAERNILIALILNLGFALIELVGGIYTNSIAILSDALHDFGDSLSLGVAWYLQRVSKRPRDHVFSYGYKRFSLLGALVVSAVLLVGVVLVVRESVVRLLHPQMADARGMLIFAILGVLINGYAALKVKAGSSLNERAVYLHLLEDALGWIAVLISSLVMLFVHLPILDPLISLLISAFILYNVVRNLRSVFRILLMEVPQNLDMATLESSIRQVRSVENVEDLHIFTLDGENHVLTLQVIVSEKSGFRSLQQMKRQIRQIAAEQGIFHSTIEFCCASEERHQHH